MALFNTRLQFPFPYFLRGYLNPEGKCLSTLLGQTTGKEQSPAIFLAGDG